VPAGRLGYGLGTRDIPYTLRGGMGPHRSASWHRRRRVEHEDASRQMVLVVNSYPHSPELERAVLRTESAAFCGTP
jgi:hypothetical protein